MERAINNVTYNTRIARWIAGLPNPRRDTATWIYEELYRTESGEYFLYGQGGAETCYKDQTYGIVTSGEDIIPLSVDKAIKWAQEKLPVDEYKYLFGDNDNGVAYWYPLKIAVPGYILTKLEQLHNETGKSISQIIVDRFNQTEQISTPDKK